MVLLERMKARESMYTKRISNSILFPRGSRERERHLDAQYT